MGLPLSEFTIADLFKTKIQNFTVGKWHLGAHESGALMSFWFNWWSPIFSSGI